jgi:hypothetical protein
MTIRHSRSPAGKRLARIPVRTGLAASLTIRWARHDAGLTQTDLGRLAGVRIARTEGESRNQVEQRVHVHLTTGKKSIGS